MFLIVIVVFLLPYSISNWLVWQNLKEGTPLPVGNFTMKHGNKLGFYVKLFYIGTLIALVKYEGFIIFATFPIVWFLSGWISVYIERKIYMKRVGEEILMLADGFSEKVSPGYALIMLELPEWWIKLMTKDWIFRYYSILDRYNVDDNTI